MYKPMEPKADGLYYVECCTDRYFLEKSVKASELAGWEPEVCWSLNGSTVPESWQYLMDTIRPECWAEWSNWVSLTIMDKRTFESWPMEVRSSQAVKAYLLEDCREEIIGLTVDGTIIYFEDDVEVPTTLAGNGWQIHTINAEQDFWWLRRLHG